MNWLVPWEPSYIVSAATLLALAFFCKKKKQERIFFGLGTMVIYFALHTHFDYYAEHSFFMHCIQQSLLHHIGPFLLVLGGTRFRLFGGVFNALIFFTATIFWLIPAVHSIAMLDWRIYRFMNWSMMAGGLLFWSAALDCCLPLTNRVIMLVSVIPLQIATGALLFSSGDIYPVYALCGRVFSGLSAHDDQQLGALAIWLCGPMMSAIALLMNVGQQIKSAENENPYGIDEMPVERTDAQTRRSEPLEPAPES